jgi:hypothetical protein
MRKKTSKSSNWQIAIFCAYSIALLWLWKDYLMKDLSLVLSSHSDGLLSSMFLLSFCADVVSSLDLMLIFTEFMRSWYKKHAIFIHMCMQELNNKFIQITREIITKFSKSSKKLHNNCCTNSAHRSKFLRNSIVCQRKRQTSMLQCWFIAAAIAINIRLATDAVNALSFHDSR